MTVDESGYSGAGAEPIVQGNGDRPYAVRREFWRRTMSIAAMIMPGVQ